MKTLNTLARHGTSASHRERGENRERTHAAEQAGVREQAAAEPASAAPRTDGAEPRAGSAARALKRDADGMAVASFVLGLPGLLVFNLLLGPCAMVLAGLALARGTKRRGRAVLGLTLGVADLAVLAAVTAADQSFSWSLAG